MRIKNYLTARPLKLVLLLVMLLQFAPATVMAQGRADKQTVKGRVLDGDGIPVAGAAVQNLAEKTYAVTDGNGEFEIAVKDLQNAVLDISFLGMDNLSVPVAGRTRLDLTMTASKLALDEVVVTGYQTIAKERATGSFDKVESQHLAVPSSNIAERLVGSAAGLAATTDANGDITFQIRGLSTLVASNKDPLLIVDGFPIEAPISSLNPNTIESITVLKDAAAASIWGAKAANGVIVVTTKNGKAAGADKGKTVVTFNTMWKASPKIDNDYWSANASNEELIDWQIYQFQNQQFGYMALIGDGNANNNIRFNYNSYSNLFVMLNENRLGYVSDSELQSYIARIRTQSNKQQINDYLLANPFTQQYNLTIAHSGENISTNVSALYEGGQRYLQGNNYDKYSFNSNTTVNIYKWLDLNINGAIYYNVARTNGQSFLGPEFELFFDEQGNYTDVIRSYDNPYNERYFYTPNIRRYFNWQAFPYQDWGFNPVQEMRGRNNTTKTLDARIQGGLKFKLAPGINFESKVQYEMLNTDYRRVDDESTWYVRSTVNIAATSDKTATGAVTANLPKGSILRQNRTYTSAYDWRNQFNFDRTFADRHQVTFIAGAEISDRAVAGVTNPMTYGYNDETLAVGKFLGSAFSYKNYFNSNSTFSSYVNSYTFTHDRYFSAYANAAYTLDGKYTLSASARTDASNFITDDPKYRYAPFWSVGAKWIASKEDFLDVDGVDYLAFRLTYGYNGNVDRSTSVWPVLSYNTSTDVLTQEHNASFSSYGNTSMRWERTGTIDLGIDFDLWGGALSGKLDIYNKKGRDLLATVNLPAATGASSNKINAAEMTNRGFELELGTFQKWGEFSWRSALMLAYNFNRIDKLVRTSYTGFQLSGQRNQEDIYRAGYNAFTLWSYEYGGMINTGTEANPAYYPSVMQGDKKVAPVQNQTGDWSEYMINAGTSVAPWNMSFSNTLSYGNFDLSFLITGKFGHKFRRLSFNYSLMPKLLPNLDMAEVLSQKGDKYFPFASKEYCDLPLASNISKDMNWWPNYTYYMTYAVESATWFRLQEITLSYRLPATVVNRLGIGGLSVYLKGNNLALLTFNKYHEDPEFPLGNVRPVASGTLGVNFTF
ncbi:MAG: SusC/RagA family TonB-linked outer membrane protein [Bacteroidales bacterium]|nr:SusC/RagA family TonB-linked outer membrane protein [Bacteroidales bacterium]